MPYWLHLLSIVSLIVALIIVIDLFRHKQHMWIMNIVWPVTATFGSVFALWAYFRYGRLATHEKVMAAKENDEEPPHQKLTPFGVKVGKGASHCGSGCTCGDVVAEWMVVFFPVIATWFGYKAIFDHKMFAVWIFDYILAFLFGVAFQYFTIKPMRDLSPGQGLIQAVKADTLSLTSWQIGMYGWMAVAHFWIFGQLLNHQLETATVEFWFMMQIAMWFGFVTSYPVNWWLLRKGIKEKM